MNTQMTTWKRWRLFSMLLFLTSSAFFGFLDYLLHDSESWMRVSWMVDVLVATAAIATWCHFDARILDYRISRRLRVWIVLASLIAVPIYIVKSRGWRGAWRLGLGLPFFAVSIWSHDFGWSLASYVIRPGVALNQNQTVAEEK